MKKGIEFLLKYFEFRGNAAYLAYKPININITVRLSTEQLRKLLLGIIDVVTVAVYATTDYTYDMPDKIKTLYEFEDALDDKLYVTEINIGLLERLVFYICNTNSAKKIIDLKTTYGFEIYGNNVYYANEIGRIELVCYTIEAAYSLHHMSEIEFEIFTETPDLITALTKKFDIIGTKISGYLCDWFHIKSIIDEVNNGKKDIC